MFLKKDTININFSQGLDTKTDPHQVEIGKFLALQNTVFTKGGLLQKRNGYKQFANLPTAASFTTTFNGNLTAIGTSIQAYLSGPMSWVSKGSIQPVSLSTLSLIRSSTNQTQADSAVAFNGPVCTVYTDQVPSGGSNVATYKYVVADSTTGQNVVAPTAISAADATYGTPRVFVLGNYFVIVFTKNVSGVYHLQYFAISINNPTTVTSPADITTSYVPATTLAFDGAVMNNRLYLAWPGASSSGIKMATLSSSLGTGAVSSTVVIDAAHQATLMSVCADPVNNNVWASYYNSGTGRTYAVCVDQNLNSVLGATELVTGTIANIASAAFSGTLTCFFEGVRTYSFDASVKTNAIGLIQCLQTGSPTAEVKVSLGVGLASKVARVGSYYYFLSAYNSAYQPTYFLMSVPLVSPAAYSGQIIAKLAYENGGGYLVTGLPSLTVTGTTLQTAYLIKDLVQATNKSQSPTSATPVFSQTGVNLASFTITTNDLYSVEIGNNLNLTGGFPWMYDGYLPVEQGFHLWPDYIELSGSASGGSMTAQQYYYQVTYEWTDNQGNLFRSAPSVPVTITTTGSTSSVTLHIPTLRLTAKTGVKICVYRWSAAHETYYQVTSITTPTLNSTTADSIDYVDTLADSSIVGNNILYTTGGVLENISGPACNSMFLFDDRAWLIDAEDPNLLWYSKQVLEATPVEFSDEQTLYVAPSVGAQGPTGPLTCGFEMDDKAILFRASAIDYIAGSGPDPTGANSQYTQPLFITSTVGCSNQKSIVLQPQGLMFEFQSEAGNQIWLLGRDLSTQYIGAPVEAYTQSATVQSAVNIPGTNQVRFTMSSGITLVYDYYYGQWGSFSGVPAVSSTLFQGLHTYINKYGQVFQESPGSYLDGSNPVVMSFTTSWIHLAGLQGYQRAYMVYLLGTYLSPHKLLVQIASDYNPSPTQQSIIVPGNFAPVYGQDSTYGSGDPYGGPGNREQWRVFLTQQRCEAFQITVSELYDPSYGQAAGAGLTLSGINAVVGIKKGYRPSKAVNSVG